MRMFNSAIRRLYVRLSRSPVGERNMSENGSHSSNARLTECTASIPFKKLQFDNAALRSLPIDDLKIKGTREVKGACFSHVTPTPVLNPKLVCRSHAALLLLGIDNSDVAHSDFCEYFSGNKLFPGSQPAAHCYCGHQFGNFAGQLGDGAAMYLGEIINRKGERWELQLKGAGLTPYSRTADGRKVLRSSIREFLMSEAMYFLGIPTTRAGTCLTSDSSVMRDVFYDGNPIEERCSIVSRIAPTFIRFGSFEIFKDVDPMTGRSGPSIGRVDILGQLTDYVVQNFYSEIWDMYKNDKPECYKKFFQEVVRRTALLVAQWQCVGWCHGVLNTDNMSIVGVTIDYGPFGFMDSYEPSFICNASDSSGRYAYNKQPEICKWNCQKLAEALQPLIPQEDARTILQTFDDVYKTNYYSIMKKKIGLVSIHDDVDDRKLIDSLLDTMATTGADFINTFRGLSRVSLPGCGGFDTSVQQTLEYLCRQCCNLQELKEKHRPRMTPRQLNMFMQLLETNPELLAALGRGLGEITKELERLEKTKELQGKTEESVRDQSISSWTLWLNQYTERLKNEVKDESSLEQQAEHKRNFMNSVNPRVVLRNYLAQRAIDKAEQGDYSEVQSLLKVLSEPYSDSDTSGVEGALHRISVQGPLVSSTAEEENSIVRGASCDTSADTSTALLYDCKPPTWANTLKVT